MRGYDRWKLQSPYEGPELPSSIENRLGVKFELHGEPAEVVAAWPEDDEDEDGKHRIWVFGVELFYDRDKDYVELTEMELKEALGGA